MAKKKIKATDMFVRSITATKGDEKISVACQPYVLGMYVVLENRGARDQLNVPHEKFAKFIKTIENNLIKDNFELEKHECEYSQFLSAEEIELYLNK